MAITTSAKRASAIAVALPFGRTGVPPGGGAGLDERQRAHAQMQYSGLIPAPVAAGPLRTQLVSDGRTRAALTTDGRTWTEAP